VDLSDFTTVGFLANHRLRIDAGGHYRIDQLESFDLHAGSILSGTLVFAPLTSWSRNLISTLLKNRE
jgi:hypothetical protein